MTCQCVSTAAVATASSLTSSPHRCGSVAFAALHARSNQAVLLVSFASSAFSVAVLLPLPLLLL